VLLLFFLLFKVFLESLL